MDTRQRTATCKVTTRMSASVDSIPHYKHPNVAANHMRQLSRVTRSGRQRQHVSRHSGRSDSAPRVDPRRLETVAASLKRSVTPEDKLCRRNQICCDDNTCISGSADIDVFLRPCPCSLPSSVAVWRAGRHLGLRTGISSCPQASISETERVIWLDTPT